MSGILCAAGVDMVLQGTLRPTISAATHTARSLPFLSPTRNTTNTITTFLLCLPRNTWQNLTCPSGIVGVGV